MQTKTHTSQIRISIAFYLLGILFKINHWPGANVMICVSLASILIFYSIRYSNKLSKQNLDHIKLVFVVFWSISSSFSILHLPFAYISQIVALISFVGWLFLEGPQNYFRGFRSTEISQNKRIFLTILFVVAGFAYLVGALFKIMHWPGAGILLMTGTLFGVLWLILGISAKGVKI